MKNMTLKEALENGIATLDMTWKGVRHVITRNHVNESTLIFHVFVINYPSRNKVFTDYTQALEYFDAVKNRRR